jgi:hypothetical protein
MLNQTTTKSPPAADATEGLSCWSVVYVLTRNPLSRGAPAVEKRRARIS